MAHYIKQKEMSADRNFKSRIFEMLYSDRRELLDLYNAINGTSYSNPELLEINTLENAVYMAMRNDISFVVDLRLSLYEHQSTYSPNLPLRYLFYVSDMYSLDEKSPALELEAVMLNINRGCNQKLMDSCKSLREYSEYTARVREYAAEMELEDAVERAITECIREGILSDFLRKNRAEARKVSIYEYDAEKHIRMERAEAKEEGREELLLEQIKKKLDKGKALHQIAEELEQDEAYVSRLLEKIRKTS